MAELLLVTPARDEAPHLERTIRAVAAQTRRPDLWLIVDDGSTDATPEILARAATELPFLRVLRAPQHDESGGDRLALAAEARAFNWALADIDLDDYTHLGKLDADVELSSEYVEHLLQRFDEEPGLGVAGGRLLERGAAGWQPTKVPAYHVRGALKTYSRECFAAIGGVEERLGWDTIDETYARMNGFATRSFPELTARHHRPVATRGGTLRGRARHGQCAYILRRLVGGPALAQGRLLAALRHLRRRLPLRLRPLGGAPRRTGRGRALPPLRLARAARARRESSYVFRAFIGRWNPLRQ